MTKSFEVLDLRPDASGERIAINAHSPEKAAAIALGLDLVRSGASGAAAVKVYWPSVEGLTNVVRLYNKVESDRVRR